MEGMARVGEILSQDTRLRSSARTASAQVEAERTFDDIVKMTELDVARFNSEAGYENRDGSYDCKICKNRGYIMRLVVRNGMCYRPVTRCQCMDLRDNVRRMRGSGMEANIRDQSLKKFDATDSWQRTMLESANRYAREGVDSGAWFFIGGAVGAGKTHLCTGISRDLMYRGKAVLLMPWQTEAVNLKGNMYDDQSAYDAQMSKYRTAEILYIDDFLKPARDKDPTAADIQLAYDIINARYNARKPTIISSERYLDEVIDIDEAVGSRIKERSASYRIDLERDKAKNHRLR